jgi:hypothetical protein
MAITYRFGDWTYIYDLDNDGRDAGTSSTLTGTLGDDKIFGYGGDDVLSGLLGRNSIYGGAGRDTVSYADIGRYGVVALSVNLATGGAVAEDAAGAVLARDVLIGIEDVIGSNADDLLVGSAAANTLRGLGGDDTLQGGGGDDVLRGDNGRDLLQGGTGDDFLSGGAGNDWLVGGAGQDFLRGGEGLDTASYAHLGAGRGVEVRLGENGAAGTAVELVGGVGDEASRDTLVEIEKVMGSRAADRLHGNEQANVIWTKGGADLVEAGAGNDFIVAESLDFALIDGGAGTDTLSLTAQDASADLRQVAGSVTGIERISLRGAGDTTLTLDYDSVMAITGGAGGLLVLDTAGAGNVVLLDGAWVEQTTHANGMVTYAMAEARLTLEATVTAMMGAKPIVDLNPGDAGSIDAAASPSFFEQNGAAVDVSPDGLDLITAGGLVRNISLVGMGIQNGGEERIVFAGDTGQVALDFSGEGSGIGLSKARENRTFAGLPLDARLAAEGVEARCGLYVIDLKTGDVAHHVRIGGVITELYDIATLPDTRNPMAIGFRSEEIRRVLSVGQAPD